MPHHRLGHGQVRLHREYVLVDIVEEHPHRGVAVHLPPFHVALQAMVKGLHLKRPPVG